MLEREFVEKYVLARSSIIPTGINPQGIVLTAREVYMNIERFCRESENKDLFKDSEFETITKGS